MKKQIVAFLLTIIMAVYFIACDTSKPASENEAGSYTEQNISSDLINAIIGSYSERSFKEGEVPYDIMETILYCGQKAPSAGNAQPWHFTVIKNNEIARRIAPRHYAEGAVVIIISGKPNERVGVNIAFDAALASQNIYLAAQALGFGTRQYYTGVQDINENQKTALGIPDDYTAQIIMLIGYKADDVDVLTAASARRSPESNVNYIE